MKNETIWDLEPWEDDSYDDRDILDLSNDQNIGPRPVKDCYVQIRNLQL